MAMVDLAQPVPIRDTQAGHQVGLLNEHMSQAHKLTG
jgi:hypothetical protein